MVERGGRVEEEATGTGCVGGGGGAEAGREGAVAGASAVLEAGASAEEIAEPGAADVEGGEAQTSTGGNMRLGDDYGSIDKRHCIFIYDGS